MRQVDTRDFQVSQTQPICPGICGDQACEFALEVRTKGTKEARPAVPEKGLGELIQFPAAHGTADSTPARGGPQGQAEKSIEVL
jgi:hypothetical protein